VKGGPRGIVRALVLSILAITVIYVAFVLAVLNGLGMDGLKGSKAVGADVMQAAFGPAGAQLIGIIVGIATLTSINATMIVGARTNYALGRDWPVLAFIGQWHGTRHVPVVAFVVQAVIALALIAFGALQKDGFSAMVEFTAPVFWLFFLLTGVGLFVLRFREPHVARPFKVPLYPILPIVFVVTCGYLFYSSVTYAQSQQAVHITYWVMGLGVVAWALMRVIKGR
jgi:basic amino acid/polyamine antiporter, APA family